MAINFDCSGTKVPLSSAVAISIDFDESCIERELQCGICGGFLIKNPVLLPYHNRACTRSNFCYDCLAGICKSSKKSFWRGLFAVNTNKSSADGEKTTLTCPICKVNLTLKGGGIESLATNTILETVSLKYVARLNHRSNDAVVYCQICDHVPPRRAVANCTNCVLFYCARCLERFHPSRGALAKHKVVQLRAEGTRQVASRSPFCSEHSQPLDLYCYTCPILFCKSCQICCNHIGLNHQVESVQRAYECLKGLLSESHRELSEAITQIVEEAKGFKAKIDKFSARSQPLKKLVKFHLRKSSISRGAAQECEELTRITARLLSKFNWMADTLTGAFSFQLLLKEILQETDDCLAFLAIHPILNLRVGDSLRDCQMVQAEMKQPKVIEIMVRAECILQDLTRLESLSQCVEKNRLRLQELQLKQLHSENFETMANKGEKKGFKFEYPPPPPISTAEANAINKQSEFTFTQTIRSRSPPPKIKFVNENPFVPAKRQYRTPTVSTGARAALNKKKFPFLMKPKPRVVESPLIAAHKVAAVAPAITNDNLAKKSSPPIGQLPIGQPPPTSLPSRIPVRQRYQPLQLETHKRKASSLSTDAPDKTTVVAAAPGSEATAEALTRELPRLADASFSFQVPKLASTTSAVGGQGREARRTECAVAAVLRDSCELVPFKDVPFRKENDVSNVRESPRKDQNENSTPEAPKCPVHGGKKNRNGSGRKSRKKGKRGSGGKTSAVCTCKTKNVCLPDTSEKGVCDTKDNQAETTAKPEKAGNNNQQQACGERPTEKSMAGPSISPKNNAGGGSSALNAKSSSKIHTVKINLEEKETMAGGDLGVKKVDFILDPRTAHKDLSVSEDGKTTWRVTPKRKKKVDLSKIRVPDNQSADYVSKPIAPKSGRFAAWSPLILGDASLSSGRSYWEVYGSLIDRKAALDNELCSIGVTVEEAHCPRNVQLCTNNFSWCLHVFTRGFEVHHDRKRVASCIDSSAGCLTTVSGQPRGDTARNALAQQLSKGGGGIHVGVLLDLAAKTLTFYLHTEKAIKLLHRFKDISVDSDKAICPALALYSMNFKLTCITGLGIPKRT